MAVVLFFTAPWNISGAHSPRRSLHVHQNQDSLPRELAEARAALESGDSARALDLAEKYMFGHQRDSRGFLLVGDLYASRLPRGLFRAVQAYRNAYRADPHNPEPFYKLAQVGLAVRGSNGEALVTEGLEKALSIDPLYGDAWEQWLTVYRSAGRREEMIGTLLPHDTLVAVRAMIAQLLIEEERYQEADSMVATVLATDSTNVEWLALRAQGALEAGDLAPGLQDYNRALSNAEHDSTDALWKQVVGIATPDELILWSGGVPPERRADWLRAFWARRNPDLFAGMNGRIAEHFARLRMARREHPWLNPLIDPDFMEAGRPLFELPTREETDFVTKCEVFAFAVPSRIGLGGAVGAMDPGPYDRTRVMVSDGQAFLLQLPPSLAGITGTDSASSPVLGYNMATGLSDRGLTLLRLGPPDQQVLGGDNPLYPDCNTTELVRWRYQRWGEIRFNRVVRTGQRTAGEISFQPLWEPQYQATMVALTEDHSSVPAPLVFGVWTAQFKNPIHRGHTDVAVVTTQGRAAASLIALDGGTWEVRQSGTGVVVLRAEPGSHSLVAHAEVGEELGRQTLAIEVVSFDTTPSISDLLLGSAWGDGAVDRQEMLQHVQRDLTFRSGDTVRTYAELYGLAA